MRIFTIAGREMRSLFFSLLAWIILAVVQGILGYVFLIQMELFLEWQGRLPGLPDAPGLTEIVAIPLLRTAGIVLLLVVPMLTMRLVSEERRNRTLSLLLSAPVSMTEIVLGKFFGVMGFLLCMLLLITLLPLSLLAGGTLDFGLFLSGLLGLFLLTTSFAAAGLFFSSLTTQPTIAAISSFGLLLLLWILDWAGTTGTPGVGELFRYLSLLTHFEDLLKGMFNTKDLAYYLLFIGTFLVFSIRRLDAERLQP
jgi:ABC-2 type transport system permease protein